MNLPEIIIPYFLGVLSAPWHFSITYLSSMVGVSHDSINRSLMKKYDWKGGLKALLKGIDLNSGYLIIDETDIDKSYSRHIQNALWIFSHRRNTFVFGYHLVVLAWTDGDITVPLAWKIYDARTNKKKITKLILAKELLEYAFNKLNIHPLAVLFDSFYASYDILSYLKERGIVFVSQVQKNRKIDGKRVSSFPGAYWTRQGKLTHGLKVQIVRNRKKYFVTNAENMSRKEQLDLYHLRWRIEEIFRFTKQETGLEECHAQKERIQHNHFGVCFMLFGLLQVNRQETDKSLYQMKHKAILDKNYATSLVNSIPFAYA